MPPATPATPRHTAEFVTLKEYTDTRLDAVEKSIAVACETIDRRLASMNEFRKVLSDQANTFLSKAEYAIVKDKLDADIRLLRESAARAEGKASQSSLNITTLISVSGLVLGLIGLVLKLVGL